MGELLAASPKETLQNRLSNIELCNGSDRSSPDPQIKGCTALIETGKETALVLAIAHNNRGDALSAKGEFDRAISDYEYELQMALMNRRLAPGIETVFMMPAENYSYLSSHLVKEIAGHGGSITGLVPELVENRLKDKFKNQA